MRFSTLFAKHFFRTSTAIAAACGLAIGCQTEVETTDGNAGLMEHRTDTNPHQDTFTVEFVPNPADPSSAASCNNSNDAFAFDARLSSVSF